MTIDSTSVGDPTRFRSLPELVAALDQLPSAPTARGRVALLVSRRDGGRRATPTRVHLTPEGGMPGDAWGRKPDRTPESQLTAMQLDVATLLAHGQPLPLFGDNLLLELDLGRDHLPTGTRVRVGAALLEVTAKPHNGCGKFQARFGADALRLVAMAERRHRNLRGIYLRVVAAGDVAVGDVVEVLRVGAPGG